MKNHSMPGLLKRLAIGLVIFFAGSPLCAANTPDADDWQFVGELYGWGAHMKGTAFTGDDFTVPLHDILSGLDFMFMGALAARKNDWALFADLVYLDIGGNKDVKLRPLHSGNDITLAHANLDLKSYISTFGGAYQVAESGNSNFYLLAGARFLRMDMELGVLRSNGNLRQVDESSSNWDFIAGGRGQFDLNEKWLIHYYADIGTGDSDLTWQTQAGINYRLKRTSLVLGYRIIKWEFDTGTALEDLSAAGPYMGLKINF